MDFPFDGDMIPRGGLHIGFDLRLAIEVAHARFLRARDIDRFVDEVSNTGFDGDVGDRFAVTDLVLIGDVVLRPVPNSAAR
ncbi:MAG TPA: hypothetical protein VGC40_03860 [Paenirhodobacter sp.]